MKKFIISLIIFILISLPGFGIVKAASKTCEVRAKVLETRFIPIIQREKQQQEESSMPPIGYFPPHYEIDLQILKFSPRKYCRIIDSRKQTVLMTYNEFKEKPLGENQIIKGDVQKEIFESLGGNFLHNVKIIKTKIRE